jgi:plastocyanin
MKWTVTMALFAVALTAPVAAHEVTGRVRVTGRTDAAAKTIVYAERLEGGKPAARRARLTQKDKSFTPRVVAVPAGSTVDFPNEDPIFHNVFSLSPPGGFDLGLYRAGASKNKTFAQPATYRIFCNIHPEMTAVLIVLPTEYITEADATGAWKLSLPAGRYRVTAWSERAQPATVELTVGNGPATAGELTLDESKFVELPHKNKYGQDYPKNPYDPKRDKKPG